MPTIVPHAVINSPQFILLYYKLTFYDELRFDRHDRRSARGRRRSCGRKIINDEYSLTANRRSGRVCRTAATASAAIRSACAAAASSGIACATTAAARTMSRIKNIINSA